MFDTHFTHVGGGHTTVTEKRAPTDESVRLLRELEEAAEKRVLERGASPDNDLNYTWTIRHNYAENTLTICVRFSLNGREHTRTFEWPMSRWCGDPRERLKGIRDEVAHVIATEVVHGLITPENLRTLTDC